MVSGTSSPSANSEMIRLADAWKVYKMGTQQVNALAGINTSFSKGSFWAIMGPSGSGKSTMMNILGCLDRLTSGRYYFDGQDISTLNDDALSELRLRRIGFIFQSFNLIPQLTVQKILNCRCTILAGILIAAVNEPGSWPNRLDWESGLGIVRRNHQAGRCSGSPLRHWPMIRRSFLQMNQPATLTRRPDFKFLVNAAETECRGENDYYGYSHEPDIAAFANTKCICGMGRLSGLMNVESEANSHRSQYCPWD